MADENMCEVCEEKPQNIECGICSGKTCFWCMKKCKVCSSNVCDCCGEVDLRCKECNYIFCGDHYGSHDHQ